jgi:hypothetical protein
MAPNIVLWDLFILKYGSKIPPNITHMTTIDGYWWIESEFCVNNGSLW